MVNCCANRRLLGPSRPVLSLGSLRTRVKGKSDSLTDTLFPSELCLRVVCVCKSTRRPCCARVQTFAATFLSTQFITRQLLVSFPIISFTRNKQLLSHHCTACEGESAPVKRGRKEDWRLQVFMQGMGSKTVTMGVQVNRFPAVVWETLLFASDYSLLLLTRSYTSRRQLIDDSSRSQTTTSRLDSDCE